MVMSIAVTSVEEKKRQFALIVFSTEYTEHNKLKLFLAVLDLKYFQLNKSISKKAILQKLLFPLKLLLYLDSI